MGAQWGGHWGGGTRRALAPGFRQLLKFIHLKKIYFRRKKMPFCTSCPPWNMTYGQPLSVHDRITIYEIIRITIIPEKRPIDSFEENYIHKIAYCAII